MAVEAHDIDSVIALLELGALPDAKSRYLERTPLHLAAREGGVMTGILLARGAGTDVRDFEGWTALHHAAEGDHVGEARLLLEHGAAVDALCNSGMTPLGVAAFNGNLAVGRLLLGAGAKPGIHSAAGLGRMDLLREWQADGRDVARVRDFQRRIPLHWAAAAGQREVVEYLLGLGADATALAKMGVNPIELAVEHGRLEVLGPLLDAYGGRQSEQELLAELLRQSAQKGRAGVAAVLLRRGAPVDAPDERGRTALHLAAERGHLDAMVLLLRAAADKEARDSEGMTPLYYALWAEGPAAVHILILAGADVNAADHSGATPLQLADNLEVGEALVLAGADLNAADDEHYTPLYRAMRNRNHRLARFLVRKGARHDVFTAAGIGDVGELARLLAQTPQAVHAVDFVGYTPLHYAAWHGHTDAVELLLTSGANVRAGEDETETPLHLAFMRWHGEAARLLLEAGVDPRIRDGLGGTAVSRASTAPDDSLARLCFEGPAHLGQDDPAAIGTLQAAATLPDALSTLNYLLDLGVPQVAADGYSALHGAAGTGQAAACRVLLAHGADVDGRNRRGRTPLHSGAIEGDPEILRLLLRAGAALEVSDDEGMTPLHLAARMGHEEALDLLLAHGAEIEARDAQGKTPMHWAAWDGSVAAAQVLLGRGASTNVLDTKGSTPLTTAEEMGHWGVLELLEDR